MTVPGLTAQRSAFNPKQTANRLAAAIQARGLTLFARVDQGFWQTCQISRKLPTAGAKQLRSARPSRQALLGSPPTIPPGSRNATASVRRETQP